MWHVKQQTEIGWARSSYVQTANLDLIRFRSWQSLTAEQVGTRGQQSPGGEAAAWRKDTFRYCNADFQIGNADFQIGNADFQFGNADFKIDNIDFWVINDEFQLGNYTLWLAMGSVG